MSCSREDCLEDMSGFRDVDWEKVPIFPMWVMGQDSSPITDNAVHLFVPRPFVRAAAVADIAGLQRSTALPPVPHPCYRRQWPRLQMPSTAPRRERRESLPCPRAVPSPLLLSPLMRCVLRSPTLSSARPKFS